MKTTPVAIALASLVSATPNLYAQSSSETETLVVTANRFEQSIENTIAPVEVVTKEEIDAIQAKSLTEVLRRLPGVQVSSSGGYGQSQSVFVRGTESKHVLVLVNGIRMGSATTGAADFSAIPLTGVERIEFIRGSRAAVYGSDAVSGVINIITEYREGESTSNISLGGGSEQYKTGKVAASGEISENFWGKFAFNYEESDGISASSEPTQTDDDGFESRDVVAEIGGYVHPDWRVRASVFYHDGYVEFDYPEDSEKDSELAVYAIGAEYLGSQLYSNFTAAFHRDLSKIGSDSIYQTDRKEVNWQNQYKLSETVSFGGGIDWYRNDISESTSTYEKQEQDNLAFYLMGFYTNQVVIAEANVRSDDNEEYGINNTWQLGLGWKVAPNMKLTGSTGTAFKAPTFNDLYFPLECFPPFGCFGGNQDLQPEESEIIEVGFEGEWDLFDVRIALYKQKIDNLIDWGNTPENVDKAQIKGIELITNFSTGLFDHNVSLEYLDPENETTGKQLRRRSKQMAKWNVSYFADEWQADLSYLYQGERYEDTENTKKLGGYSLFDIAASYFVTDSFILKGRIANLFDKDYVLSQSYNQAEDTYYSFNTQGRSYYLTATYEF